MQKLEPVITVEEIIKSEGKATGQAPIDAVVSVLKATRCIRSRDIAEALGVSERELNAAVHLLTGSDVKELAVLWRVNQAKHLLRDTELSYAEIANRCGYSDPRTLIRIFEKYEKVTPYTYRTGQIIPHANYRVNAKYKQIQRQILRELNESHREIIKNARKK